MSRSRACAAAALSALFTLALYGCSGPSAHTPVGPGSPSPTSSHAPAPKPTPAKPVNKPVALTHGSGPGGSMIRTGSSAVALTFDDGPDPVNTPKMLDLLKRNGVKATFCLIGTSVRSYPALVRRIVAEGHTVCNHSWRHRLDLAKQTDAVIRKDLADTTNAILRAAPNAKIKYFRAPGGNFTSHLVAIAASMGMKSIYWAVDPRDWDARTYGHGASMVNHILYVVRTRVRPGAIILSHDSHHPDTITAYATLIPWLKARYKLIPLPT